VAAIKSLLEADATKPDITPWRSTLSGWQEQYPLTYEPQQEGEGLKPQMVLEALRDAAPEDCIVASGVGQHQMWASQYWTFRHPYTWINSGGLGTMGFSVPAAIGAKVGRPDRMVWAIDGDGCFQMTAQELVTAAAERIPVKIAILNNAYLGMVRQWQEMFYEERYSEVYLSPDLPDYVKWAEAMGCVAFRVEHPDEVLPTIEKANAIDDRPVVIEFRTDAVREGVPDGPRRQVQLRGQGAAVPRGPAGAIQPGGGQVTEVRHHTLSVLVENKAGVLARVVNLFSRRAYNIYSLAVAPTDDERFSRITIVVDVESAPLEQIVKQLNKLINVIKITELDPRHAVERELLLATVHASVAERPQVAEVTRIFEGKIVAVSNEALTVSLEGHPPRSTTSRSCCARSGSCELQRTGRVALPKLDREPARLHAVSGIKPKVS
jgi:acetolactate synthase small subunit